MPLWNMRRRSTDDALPTHPLSRKHGFTLAELLIVVAIIAVLLVIALLNWKTQITKGYDAQRKADLDRIRRAFEDYYNDHNCYPPSDILSGCGGVTLQPYLKAIPCDPQTKLSYKYVPADEANVCKGYKIFASLANLSDADIVAQGCSPLAGCGYEPEFNYGLSSGVSLTPPGFDPGVPPPPEGLPPGKYACYPGGPCTGQNACNWLGTCNSIGQPLEKRCPWTYDDGQCLNECTGRPENWCLQ